jgi:hypothetical protein
MGHHYDIPPGEEIQDAVVDSLIRRPQLIDPVMKEIGGRTAKFVTLGFQLCNVRQALHPDLFRLILQPVPNQDRLTLFVEDDPPMSSN